MNVATPETGLVTIILPTYNRAGFLSGALDSIARQTFTNWHLVVIDDGSTDNTREVIEALAGTLGGRLRYVYQENGGAYAARNRGLDEATGRYVAFFDSDDLWLPHHLARCVGALEQHADIDWAFGACRLVDRASGRTLEESTFYPGGTPRPFLSLAATSVDGLRIITDANVTECQILHGLYCGLQNSVMKRSLFDGRRFDARSRVVDDEMFVIRVLSAGARFAYFLEPHVLYQVHDDNSSGSATGLSADRHVAIFTEMTIGLEQLLADLTLTRRERRALRQRLGREYFWHLGYGAYWQAGRRADAFQAFRKGLSAWPWQAAAWKTYVVCHLKAAWPEVLSSPPPKDR